MSSPSRPAPRRTTTSAQIIDDQGHAPALLGVDESSHDYAVGRYANVALCVWRRASQPAMLVALQRALTQSQMVGEGQVALCSYLEPDFSLPDGEARGRLAAVLRSVGPGLKASAMVFEGDGFRASAVRSVATGLALLAQHSFPHRVFATTSEAAAWITGELRQRGALAPDARALDDAQNTLRMAALPR